MASHAPYQDRARCPIPTEPLQTEQPQAEVLDEALRVYRNHPDIVGAAIRQFCDVRVRPGWRRTMHNQGAVDAYRRPKLAYEVVKKRFAEAKTRNARRGHK